MFLPALRAARRRAQRGETFIREFEFPEHIRRKLAREAPEVEWEPVERGRREWLVCCAYRRRQPLAMPSRAVDYAWHAFILDTAAYRVFCDRAYGRFLDHFPEDAGNGGGPSAHETVRAWDRSRWSRDGEASLWSLDKALDLEDPWGLSDYDLAKARSGAPGGDAGGCGAGCATGDAGAVVVAEAAAAGAAERDAASLTRPPPARVPRRRTPPLGEPGRPRTRPRS